MRALVLLALLAASACGTRECKNGTAFLNVTLSGPALAATLVEVEVQVEGGEFLNGNFQVKQAGGGTVEIDFPAGYPEGKNVTLHVSAAAGAAKLATSRLAFVALPGCTPLSITVGGEDGGSC